MGRGIEESAVRRHLLALHREQPMRSAPAHVRQAQGRTGSRIRLGVTSACPPGIPYSVVRRGITPVIALSPQKGCRMTTPARVETPVVPAWRNKEVIALLDTSTSMNWEAADGSSVSRKDI